MKSKKPKIRIFTTPACSYCNTLKLFLEEKGFEYEEIDIASDDEAREEMIEKSGSMSAPVIDIDGKFIAEFDRDKICKLLNI